MDKPHKLEKIKKNLKTTGDSVQAIGWITIAGNIGLYIWSILDENMSQLGLPVSDLTGTLLIVVAMIVFIVLGKRISKGIDRNIKLYLQVLIGLFLVLLVWVFYSGGRVGILFFLVILYLISSLISINKAMKMEEFTSTLTSPSYKLTKDGWKTFAGIVTLLLFMTFYIDVNKPGISNAELLDQTIRDTKAEITLPIEVDEVTIWTDIQAEENALHYVRSPIFKTKSKPINFILT